MSERTDPYGVRLKKMLDGRWIVCDLGGRIFAVVRGSEDEARRVARDVERGWRPKERVQR